MHSRNAETTSADVTIDQRDIDRLTRASKRLFSAVSNALKLNEAFHVLNEPGDRRVRLARSAASPAIFLYENAALREQIIILTRVFDPPANNRLSFPVVRDLLSKPGIIQYFVQDARDTWPLQDPDESEATVLRHIANLDERLDRLANEVPNRLKMLRDFRNTNIAHELWHEIPRQSPQFQHVWAITNEAKNCAESVKLVIEGASVGWAEGTIGRSATWLWDVVANAVK